jgi:hypothetical protein
VKKVSGLMEGAVNKGVCAVVVGTHHEFQRHQDKMPEREEVRAQFEKRLHQVFAERKIDLVTEEASDDEEALKNLKHDDEIAAQFEQALHEMMMGDEAYKDKMANAAGGLFGHDASVEGPVPTIARTIAEKYGVRHTDVDVEVRAEEGNAESIAKRDAAMTEKILSARGDAETVLVIVGEAHRAGVSERLKSAGWSIESVHFPDA